MSDITGKDILKVFGSKVREKRKKMGISQEELGFRCGLHRTYITDIERGFRNISLINIKKLAKALKAKPSDLLNG
jgi:transcriptional regulator with XRE-family HTH domain